MNRRMFGLFVMVLLAATPAARAADWPSWRGPEQNGLVRETAIVKTWSPSGENLLWKSSIGGRTTPIILNGRVYANVPVGAGLTSGERVVCMDALTGKVVWEDRFNVYLTDIVENRVGWSAMAGDPATGNVFVHTTGGDLFCYDRDGKMLWKSALTENFGRVSGYGGRSHTPIIDEDRVIISFLSSTWGANARPSHRYAAFDKSNGELLWWAAPGGSPEDTTYSTPVVTVIDGRRLLIAGNADGNVYGLLARTGEKVWTFELSKRGLNVSVVADGKFVYAAHSEENIDNTSMGRVVCIDASKTGDITKSGEVWRFDDKTVGYCSPAIANGRLYVVDNAANMYALDLKTGRRFWQHSVGRVGKGSPLVTRDGIIYYGEQNGIFSILKDAGDHAETLDTETFERDDGLVDEIFGSPVMADGRVYFQTRYGTYCLGKRDAKVESEPIPAMPKERAAAAAKTMMLRPADVTLAPGEVVMFKPVFYDDAGVEVAVADAQPTWQLKGVPGTILNVGSFVAATENRFSAGLIEAKFNDMTASARVRVSPTLPIEESFDGMAPGESPPGWIGVTRKAVIAEKDGAKVLHKVASKSAPSPPFMRIRGYATPPIAGGYTVEADMLGTTVRNRFDPDMGLINSRYRLLVMGIKNVLRIDAWDPVPRIEHDVPFTFEPDKWYRMKFEVSHQGDVAMLRGKVWPRDADEPEAWTIEFKDPFPHPEGSAGVYAYSPGTTEKSDGPEVFFDNFKVHK